MPSLESAEDAAPAMAAIVAAVAAGDITLSEAAQLGKLVETFVRAIEARDRDKHLKLLEWQQSNWQAKFEPLGLDEDLPEELPPFTPRIRAMREQWWRMPIKDHIRMLRGAREGRWDDVPELYDPRTMTPTELRWFLLSSGFEMGDPRRATPLSAENTDHPLDKLDRTLSDQEKKMTAQELCSSMYAKYQRALAKSNPPVRKPCSNTACNM
jgi:hypothetical protein